MLHSLHLFSPKWLLGGGARLSRSSAMYLSQGTISLDIDLCVTCLGSSHKLMVVTGPSSFL